MNAASTVLHEALRAATRERHRQLDHHPVMAALMDRGLTRQDYTRALVALHDAQRWAQGQVAALTTPACLACRLDDLSADLLALGIDIGKTGPDETDGEVPSVCRVNAPDAPAAPDAAQCSESRLIGVLYVLEGSLLGARHIARHIKALPQAGAWPLAFFGTACSSQRWHAFWNFAAERLGTTPPLAVIERCRAGAIDTFDRYLASLDSSIPAPLEGQWSA